MDMTDSDGSSEAATGYTDEFFDAAVAKIEAVFGKGFAKDNPGLVGDYLVASATNLSAFMQAATAMSSGGLGDLLDQMEPGLFDLDEPPKKKTKR